MVQLRQREPGVKSTFLLAGRDVSGKGLFLPCAEGRLADFAESRV
jgi:hypothetical protein